MSKFDPMTGELISDEEEVTVEVAKEAEEITGYDPMTGEPIRVTKQEEAQEEITGYDPMTGEPIRGAKQEELQEEIIGYDPMTGEPIKAAKKEKEPEGEIIGYDPMTGEPIRGGAGNSKPEMNFDPMTGLPVVYNGGNNTYGTDAKAPEKKGKKKGLFIAIAVVAALAVIGIFVLVGIGSGMFMSKGNKVLMATANTLKDMSRLAEDLDVTGIVASGKFTVGTELELEIEDEDLEISASYAQNSKEKQLSAKGKYSYIPDVSILAGINKSEVKVQIDPIVDDYVFIYNYVEEKDGALIDLLEDELGDEAGEACIALLDLACQKLYEGNKSTEQIAKIVIDEYNSLEFEKADKKEFEVDGKDRKCKGYKTEFTEDNVLHMLEGLQLILEENAEDINQVLEEYVGTDLDMEDLVDDIADEIDFDDIELTFYIYKNKLACVEIEAEEDFEILFNEEKDEKKMELIYEDESIVEYVNSTEGNTESYTIETMGVEYAVLEYDRKSGDLEFECFGGVIEGEGNIRSGAKEKVIEISDLEVEGENIGTGIIFVHSAADMQEFDGEEFDLGNASESDFEDLAEEIMELAEVLDSL